VAEVKPSTRRILALLITRPEGVTPLDALTEAGCFRLAARVHELRAEGFEIASRTIATPNGAHISRYVLIQPSLWPVAS
jgi:hypothetical protein